VIRIRQFLNLLGHQQALILDAVEEDFTDESRWTAYYENLHVRGSASLPPLRTMEVCRAAEPEAQRAQAEAVAAVASIPAGLRERWRRRLDAILGQHIGLLGACLEAAEDRRQLATWDPVQQLRELLAEAGRELDALGPATEPAPAGAEPTQAGLAIAGQAAEPAPAEATAVEEQAPDGFFGTDGFRFRGGEVRFGRAALQQRLVRALWDAAAGRPRPARLAVNVLTEVYGEEHQTSDAAFRQLLSDTRRRLETAHLPLTLEYLQERVSLRVL
jgi:hypothetical protein